MEIAAQPYEAIIAALSPYVGEFDSPLHKVGSCWRITSPYDAWFQLAGNLTSVDIARFEAAARAALGSADPRFDMPSEERWMAAVRGVHRTHSEILRTGSVRSSSCSRFGAIRLAPFPIPTGGPTLSSASCLGMPISGDGGRSRATCDCWPKLRRAPF